MGTQSEQLARGAQQTRARLSETLDELHARMTPGHVVDQLTVYAREGPAADFFRNLAREIRENPLPLTLIGIGVAWLLIASSRSSSVRSVVCDGAMAPFSGRIDITEPAACREEPHQTPARLAAEDEDEERGRESAHAVEGTA